MILPEHMQVPDDNTRYRVEIATGGAALAIIPSQSPQEARRVIESNCGTHLFTRISGERTAQARMLIRSVNSPVVVMIWREDERDFTETDFYEIFALRDASDTAEKPQN